MPQRTTVTTVTPLPPNITRAQAVSFLHDHLNMIDLNPLVIRRTPVSQPTWSPEAEAACTWYAITDSVSLLPGSYFTSEVNYTACFQDLGDGIWTHSYAPMGVEIKNRWVVGGNEAGEARERRELGWEEMGVPQEGLYVREDCEIRCSVVMTRFIKKTVQKSHGKLVASLREKAASYAGGAARQPGRGEGGQGGSGLAASGGSQPTRIAHRAQSFEQPQALSPQRQRFAELA